MTNLTAEPEELSAFGDAEMSTEELNSLQRKVSFKRPKPQKRRSLRDLRATMSDSESAFTERESLVRFEENGEEAPKESRIARSLSVGGHRISELRKLTGQLDASQERVETLEKELKIFEGAQQSLVQEADRWKRKHNESSRELESLRNDFDQQHAQLTFLKEQMEKLQQTLSVKEREKQTLNRQFGDGLSMVEKSKEEWDSKEASYKHQIGSLTKMVAQLKEELSQEKENHFRDIRDHQQRETEAQAHVIMIKTLEAEVEKHKKVAEEAKEALDFEKRRRRASFGPAGCPEHDKMIDELQDHLKSLTEQNQSLQEEVETLRMLVADEKPLERTPEPAPISPAVSSPSSPKGKPRFPPRTSSAQDLLTMYTSGQTSGSLATELLREKVQTGVKSELTRLRDENIALVNYLAATLDSVARLR
ncbi:hypothetical protein HK097_009489 [Rhizophlyctis rosea]|uniref:Uncharacterized protein n=1 Tax=Rhizophlyctis rosea TaxID=64517 RepID=A0AAD5S8V1_9FUNG|nr:hypothetical protein HK097_009489 [Rhizophlyctis rosea]